MNRSAPALALAASLALLTGALFPSCSRSLEPLPIQDVTLKEPVDLGDAELNQAAATARASFAEFLAASSNPDSTGTAFMAKIRVRQSNPPITEDIWVSSITPEHSAKDPAQSGSAPSYTGVVGDIPAELTQLNMSDIVRFAPDQIIEWQYFEREKVVGAQVTRLRRNRMSEAERKEHDAAYEPFRFE